MAEAVARHQPTLVVPGRTDAHGTPNELLASTALDLLAPVARPHSFWSELFRRNVTAQVLLHSPLPVLVLPAVS